jgi:hypothetical protein
MSSKTVDNVGDSNSYTSYSAKKKILKAKSDHKNKTAAL